MLLNNSHCPPDFIEIGSFVLSFQHPRLLSSVEIFICRSKGCTCVPFAVATKFQVVSRREKSGGEGDHLPSRAVRTLRERSGGQESTSIDASRYFDTGAGC